MIRSRSLTGVALFSLAAAGLALTACGGGSSDDNAAPKTVTTSNNAAASSPAASNANASGGGSSSASGGEVSVVLTENKFAPNALTVKAGTTVTFVAKNEGQAVHDMKVLAQKEEGKDFASAVTIAPGTENKFTASFTKKGTYKFQCDYHMPDMAGTITVE